MVSLDILSISDKLLSISPLKLTRTTSETAKQKVTNFLSNKLLYSVSFSSNSPNKPSVSNINIPSRILKLASFKKVPYIPLVHLPELEEKSHPNKKLSKVDFPEL